MTPDFSSLISSVTYNRRCMAVGPRKAVMCHLEYLEKLTLPAHLTLHEHNDLSTDVYLLCTKEFGSEELYFKGDNMVIRFSEQAMGTAVRGYGGVSGFVPCILYWRDKFWTSIADCVPNKGDLSAVVRKSLGISSDVSVEFVYEIEAFDIPELEF